MDTVHIIYVRPSVPSRPGFPLITESGQHVGTVLQIGAFARALVRRKLGPGKVDFRFV